MIPGGVDSLSCINNRLYAGGARGVIMILDAESLAVVMTLNALAGLPGQPAALVAQARCDDDVAGVPVNRAPSAPAGQGAVTFGIFAPAEAGGRKAAAQGAKGGAVKGGRGGGRGTSGGGSGGRPATAGASAGAGAGWTGPGEREDTSMESAVSGSSRVLGLCFVPGLIEDGGCGGAGVEARLGAGRGSGSSFRDVDSSAAAAAVPPTPTILATTGTGRLMRIILPSARALRGPLPPPLPSTLLFFHFAPVWAASPCPGPGSSSGGGGGGGGSVLFASGGDDAYLCLWDAVKRRLLTRARSGKCPLPIRSIGCR